MDFFAPNYSFMALIAAILVGFVAGRITAHRADPRSKDFKKRQAFDNRMTVTANTARLSPSTRAAIEDLIGSNKLIEAIKVCRHETNMGLKEAKDVVEHIRDTSGRGARVQ